MYVLYVLARFPDPLAFGSGSGNLALYVYEYIRGASRGP